MLQEIWKNSTSTAAMYVGIILLFYIVGLFLLLIHSISQRTGQVTCYDVYMELCDVASFVYSMFQMMRSKETRKQQPISKEGVQRAYSSHANGSKTNEGNFINKRQKRHDSKIFIQSKLLRILDHVINVSCCFS